MAFAGKSQVRGQQGDLGRNVNSTELDHPAHYANKQFKIRGEVRGQVRGRVKYWVIVQSEKIGSTCRQAVAAVPVVLQVLLAVKHCLLNVFQGAESPSENAVSQLVESNLCTKVNVRVAD